MSRPGATDALSVPDTPGSSRAPTDEFFLPDLCQPRMVLAIVLVAELLAVVIALVRPATTPFLPDLGRISLFVQWLALSGAGVLCAARQPLARLSVPAATAAVFGLLIGNTAVFSGLALWLGRAGAEPLFPADEWVFLLRNEAVCVIVAALLLRYFFVSHQWRRQVRAEARSRIDALQARMRPHFLFNSMNTIAALARIDPERTEEAVEDLAELLRASLSDGERASRVADEVELTRAYQRIEQARLGARLNVAWEIAEVPADARMPRLTLQPLLENAIYHGIEPLDGGGTVSISGRADGGDVVFTVENPVSEAAEERPGNRQALQNIGERLRLAYGERGALQVERGDGRYAVTLRFPLQL